MDLRHLSLEKSQSFVFKPLKIAFAILSGSHDLPNAAAEQECQIQEYKFSQKLHEIKKIFSPSGVADKSMGGHLRWWPLMKIGEIQHRAGLSFGNLSKVGSVNIAIAMGGH